MDEIIIYLLYSELLLLKLLPPLTAMKILSLDIGDVWTGTAISDSLKMFARPYKTVETKILKEFLTTLFAQEPISMVLVGHPTTLRGTKSEQTLRVEKLKEELEQQFPNIEWLLWDERYTSQLAQELKRPRSKEEKNFSHSVAAAYILSTYLDGLNIASDRD
jgi:putative Holliday junction resolvase